MELELTESLLEVPSNMSSILELCKQINEISKKIVNAKSALFLGRGISFPIAMEGALKLKEISYIHAEGYPAAEMKHGPIALIDEKMPVVVIVTDTGYDKILSNIEEVKSRGGKLVVFSTVDSDELKKVSDDFIFLENVSSFDNSLTPILTSIPLQLLSYHIAVLKGCNVDQPRNLAKSVTVE